MHQLRVQPDGGAHGAGPQALEANDVEDASCALDGGVVLILEAAGGVLVGDGPDPGHAAPPGGTDACGGRGVAGRGGRIRTAGLLAPNQAL